MMIAGGANELLASQEKKIALMRLRREREEQRAKRTGLSFPILCTRHLKSYGYPVLGVRDICALIMSICNVRLRKLLATAVTDL